MIALSSSGKGSVPEIGEVFGLPLESGTASAANPFSRGIKTALLAS